MFSSYHTISYSNLLFIYLFIYLFFNTFMNQVNSNKVSEYTLGLLRIDRCLHTLIVFKSSKLGNVIKGIGLKSGCGL